jgi:hypothetical protein
MFVDAICTHWETEREIWAVVSLVRSLIDVLVSNL